VGPYELEVRQADPYALTYQDAIPSILLEESYDTNERLAEQVRSMCLRDTISTRARR